MLLARRPLVVRQDSTLVGIIGGAPPSPLSTTWQAERRTSNASSSSPCKRRRSASAGCTDSSPFFPHDMPSLPSFVDFSAAACPSHGSSEASNLHLTRACASLPCRAVCRYQPGHALDHPFGSIRSVAAGHGLSKLEEMEVIFRSGHLLHLSERQRRGRKAAGQWSELPGGSGAARAAAGDRPVPRAAVRVAVCGVGSVFHEGRVEHGIGCMLWSFVREKCLSAAKIPFQSSLNTWSYVHGRTDTATAHRRRTRHRTDRPEAYLHGHTNTPAHARTG